MCQCPGGFYECCISTHIGGDISCGWGELDFNGFWEFGCYECARDMEKMYAANGIVEHLWPYTKEYLDSIKESVDAS